MAISNAAHLVAEEGRFKILGIVGRGSHSIVYRAYDRETRVEVALKALEGWGSHEIYRLKREFRILRSLRHPALVEMYELFSSPSHGTFFSMEFVDGLPVVSERAEEPDGQVATASTLMDSERSQGLLHAASDLVDALLLVHAAGIVHRDVKPSNVLWRSSGGIVLLDFGLAAHRDPEGIERLIERGPAGTWVYMAPEAILGRPPTPACDWYSLAVLLFEAVTGLPPFTGTPAEVWNAKQKRLGDVRGALAGRIPDPLVDLIVASLDPDPAHRPDGGCWQRTLSEIQIGTRAPATAPVAAEFVTPSAGLFVGREDELQELATLFKQSVRGQVIVAVVSGPGGIGKTELVRQFLREISLSESPLILRARCHWQESVPFNALDGIVDELSLWLAAQQPNPFEHLTALQLDCLSRVFPVMGREESRYSVAPGPNMQPREVRRVAFESLRELLLRAADRSPLVLWIDDAQWADADSAALLGALFRPPGAPPAFMILCQRSNEPGTALPMLEDPSSRSWPDLVRTISLGPLSTASSRRLVVLHCQGTELSSGLVEEIVKEAEGSPLLISQLVQHAARCTVPGRLSPSLALRDLLSVRVEMLPVAARRILDLAAVAVHPIARDLLLRMAGVGERGRPVASSLEAARLLRINRADERMLVEPYHQRVGEVLRERLSASEIERCHVLLAQYLATEATVEEERVFHHWRAAGHLPEAAEWALRAADRAARQLAFEKAAELYAEALALGCPANAVERVEIERKRAEMLVNAGRGSAAAPVFLALAQQTADASLANELQRRATEEYLMSGHLLEGMAALGAVLQQVGLEIPASPTRALLRSAWQVVPLWWQERRARTRGVVPLVAGALARCDSCHAAAKGLSFVDPPRGLYFSLHALRWALVSGDRHRLARSLSFVGSNLLPMGGLFGRWATRMIERAGAIARMTDDAYLEAVTSLGIAQTRMMECRWSEMLSLCEHARDVFRLRCHGVAWEVAIATMAALRALEELGRLSDLHRQAAAMVQEASRAGNLYAKVTGLLYEGFCLLAVGEPGTARQLAAESTGRWKTTGFHLQHFYAARLESLCDLYEGNAAEAARRFDTLWRVLERSALMRHTIFRIDALVLRGRLALAEMIRGDQDVARTGREAERVVRALERERRVDATGWALVFRAALATSTGKATQSIEWLTAAQQKFESAGMSLAAAVAGYRAGQQCTGLVGEKLTTQAERFFASVGVAAPTRFVNMLAPGFECGNRVE